MILALLLPACSDPAPGGKVVTPFDSDEPGETGAPPVDSEDSQADSPIDSPTDSPVDSDSPAPDTADSPPPEPAGPPHIVLFIGDGMGFEHVAAASLYETGALGGTVMETLPTHGRLRTASLTGITDSAAGGTAIATGHKTTNGSVGVDADGASVENLVEYARSLGLAVGVVTTDELTGATPASFLSHVDSRGASSDIAEQAVAFLPEVMLGGGAIDMELLTLELDVNRATTADELAALSPDGRPLVGLFADTMMPYVSDGLGDAPTLAAMTEAAIDWLDDDPDGFLLVVEGARIDHASHANLGASVHLEAAALDDAVGVALAAAGGWTEPTILVTADHECGGLDVPDVGIPGEAPAATWRWGQHTNADVPVFGYGDRAAVLDGQRVDNTWIHALLRSAIDGSTFAEPEVPRLVDGWTEDLDAAVVTQTWATSEAAGFGQLDGLRVTADADGLWIGVDGVFTLGDGLPVVLLDLDYGAGTGLGADTPLTDTSDDLDAALSAVSLSVDVAGLGFDAAVGSIGALEFAIDDIEDEAGLRSFGGETGDPDAFGALMANGLFDDGNVALHGDPATDAGTTGATAGGFEILLPWEELYPSGLPAEGVTGAVVVLLLSADGTIASNQALPPLSDGAAPEGDAVHIESVVSFAVDAAGTLIGAPVVAP